MTGSFEVSAIKDVRAACPVCDPVASIYGPVPDGSGPPFLPVLPSESEVSALPQGLPRRRGQIYGAQTPADAHLACGLAPGRGRGRRGTAWGLPRTPAARAPRGPPPPPGSSALPGRAGPAGGAGPSGIRAPLCLPFCWAPPSLGAPSPSPTTHTALGVFLCLVKTCSMK